MNKKPEWWEVDQSFKAITEYDLEKNEYLDPALSPESITPFTPQALNPLATHDQEAVEESEEEDFGWFAENDEGTYFTLINKNRKTIQPGEQVFNCYGLHSNKYMLLNYGFCYQDNRYDSYEVLLRLDIPIIETFAPQVIDLDWQAPPGQG